MKPSTGSMGADGVITYGLAPCLLGWVIVGATESGICAIEFGDSPATLPAQLATSFPGAQLAKAGEELDGAVRHVVDFIETPGRTFSLPLDIQGTVFQQQVWQVLQKLKPGDTVSYAEVAKRLGKPRAVRAVASACASNRLAVVIPCHRVISSSGKLSGYRWGTPRKKKLLEMEKM